MKPYARELSLRAPDKVTQPVDSLRKARHPVTGEIIPDSSACSSSRLRRKLMMRNANRASNKRARQRLKRDTEFELRSLSLVPHSDFY